jgi:alpha-mannosidase
LGAITVERYFVVPHTHWDREWYRPFEHFRLLLGAVVDEVLDTLERDSAFTSFTLDGQAIVLEDYLEVRPEHEQRLRSLIEAGRIEVGPSYVLPDEFLVGGEPLVRNLLIGRAVCERFGGRPSPAGYLPDSFGHPMQLPQILAGFGIDSFLFSRGLGDELEELGVAFHWVAPDGSSVRALQLLGDYSNFAAVGDADEGETRVRGIDERFGWALERAAARDVLLCNGTDHTHVQPAMPSICDELERRIPGSSFEIARYGDYVAGLRSGELPSWSGELLGSRLWNVLRGVNSARLYLKQANERAERGLLATETLAALCALRAGTRFPVEDFTLAWRELLKCQPHDSICGCSCDEVHRDMLVRYASLTRTLDWLAGRALDGLERSSGRGLVNTLPFARRGVVRLDGCEPMVVALEGFEARTFEPSASGAVEAREGAVIASDRFRVEASSDGTLTVDDLLSGRRFEGLHALEDEPDVGDLYNFCPVEGATVWRPDRASTRVLADGPLIWELEVACSAPEMSIRTIVRLVRDSGRIEFSTVVENEARDHRLRVVFGAGDVSGPVRAEGQFAVVDRPLVPRPPRVAWCEPPDPTQHTCGAVALGPLALFTRGLPEYEARMGSELCLTLLRCVGLISRASGEISTRPLGAGPGTPTPEGQCLGRHVFEYALRLDGDELSNVALLRESQDYREPFLVLRPGVSFKPAIGVEGDVVFSCLKGAEDGDGLVLRVFNPGSEPASVRITGPVTARRTRLDESEAQPVVDGDHDVGPGAIASFRLLHTSYVPL